MCLLYSYDFDKHPNLKISGVPVNIAESRPVDRLNSETAAQHSAFHLLDSTPSFFVVSTLKMMMVLVVIMVKMMMVRMMVMVRYLRRTPKNLSNG